MCPKFAKVGYDTITVKVALRAKLVAVKPQLKFQEVKHHSHVTKFFNLLFKFSLLSKSLNSLICSQHTRRCSQTKTNTLPRRRNCLHCKCDGVYLANKCAGECSEGLGKTSVAWEYMW